MVCVFGSNGTKSVIWFQSNTAIICHSSGLKPGNYTFQLKSRASTFTISNPSIFQLNIAKHINNIVPKFSFEGQRSSLTVSGGPYRDDGKLKCNIIYPNNLTKEVTATVLTDHQLKCVLFPQLPGKYLVEVVQDSVTVSHTQERMLFHEVVPLPSVDSMFPSTGPVAGLSQVTIIGKNFFGLQSISRDVYCVFDGTKGAPGKIGSDSEVLCQTSPHAVGTVGVGIQVSSMPMLDTMLRFEYHAVPKIMQVSPSIGQWSRHPTAVTVYGEGFFDGEGLSCIVGSKGSYKGKYISSSAVVCLLENLDGGNHTVTISNDGVTYMKSDVSIEMLSRSMIMSVKPSKCYWVRGMKLTVFGKSFGPRSDFKCVLTSWSVAPIVIEGKLIGLDTVECLLPWMSIGKYLVEVVQDSVTVSHTQERMLFHEVVPLPSVDSMFPSTGPVAGLSQVTIIGKNFFGLQSISRDVYCVFDGTKGAPGKIGSDSEVLCQTSPHAVGTVGVGIQVSSMPMLDTMLRFEYHAVPKIMQGLDQFEHIDSHFDGCLSFKRVIAFIFSSYFLKLIYQYM
ncbi:hypothetical protein GUITHDRAFT_144016 [Guillardia theta CCMP2712]|uniref:Ig-like domain-containing protein n=1 Tax=Guillardia theta (strain CCMP2712) TaxID=905079 RepID=L1IRE8_GUITC|nr:hypothetical protein GUITHDRAFT_144016 [Guillardia theta CCMP2712]EKX38836.1 hypothetical protein GUITHDRAFT_144016 [Guillardia theta CCMP2712]|eukprot:XP_005825816.1 hypothetical protein GUITHDRAFT_144016 [Guillardia theta CCMP2712]